MAHKELNYTRVLADYKLAYHNFKAYALEYIRKQAGKSMSWKEFLTRLKAFGDDPQGELENHIDSVAHVDPDDPFAQYITHKLQTELDQI